MKRLRAACAAFAILFMVLSPSQARAQHALLPESVITLDSAEGAKLSMERPRRWRVLPADPVPPHLLASAAVDAFAVVPHCLAEESGRKASTRAVNLGPIARACGRIRRASVS
jgi:hypothetical protein